MFNWLDFNKTLGHHQQQSILFKRHENKKARMTSSHPRIEVKTSLSTPLKKDSIDPQERIEFLKEMEKTRKEFRELKKNMNHLMEEMDSLSFNLVRTMPIDWTHHWLYTFSLQKTSKERVCKIKREKKEWMRTKSGWNPSWNRTRSDDKRRSECRSSSAVGKCDSNTKRIRHGCTADNAECVCQTGFGNDEPSETCGRGLRSDDRWCMKTIGYKQNYPHSNTIKKGSRAVFMTSHKKCRNILKCLSRLKEPFSSYRHPLLGQPASPPWMIISKQVLFNHFL